jgi:hypothetical protein
MLSAAALLLALVAGSGDLQRLPAESAQAYACRSSVVPQARRCTSACTTAFGDAGDAHWDCVSACTSRALDDLTACRKGAGRVAAAPATTGGSIAKR